MCQDIAAWKESLILQAQQQLTLSNPDEKADKTLLIQYLNYGVTEIRKRRKLTNDSELLSGYHDYNLVHFIIRSYNEGGIEGASSANSLGTSKTFPLSPLAELKQFTLQVI